MNFSELKFVLVLIVKDGTVLVDVAHNRCLPARRPQEADDHVEEPVLFPVAGQLIDNLRLTPSSAGLSADDIFVKNYN